MVSAAAMILIMMQHKSKNRTALSQVKTVWPEHGANTVFT